jgi:hypothetical protein
MPRARTPSAAGAAGADATRFRGVVRRAVAIHRLLAVTAVVAAGGCSSGRYDTDFAASGERHRMAAAFQRLHAEAKDVGDGRVLLRVPKLFTEEDAKGEKSWAKPPFLKDLPGFRTAFGTQIEAGGAKLPVSLSVGVLADDQFAPEDTKRAILNAVKKEPAFAKAAWAVPDGIVPPDGQLPWAVLDLPGPQPFERIVAGNPEDKATDGTTQIWVAAHPAQKVSAVLVWRLPAELAGQVPLAELAGLVARTVVTKPVLEPAAAPAPAAAPPAN